MKTPVFSALKGLDVIAQGNALGWVRSLWPSPEGAQLQAAGGISPLQGLGAGVADTQGVALGYHIAPFKGCRNHYLRGCGASACEAAGASAYRAVGAITYEAAGASAIGVAGASAYRALGASAHGAAGVEENRLQPQRFSPHLIP